MRTVIYLACAFAIAFILAASVAKAAPAKGYSNIGTQSAVQSSSSSSGFRRVAANDLHPEHFGFDSRDRTGGGLLIEGVDRIGAAQRAGLRVGDVVTSMNGRRVSTDADFASVHNFARAQAAGNVQMTIVRNGRTMRLRYNFNTLDKLNGYVRT